MFERLDIGDRRHVEIVDEAIADGRVGFAVQRICAANNPEQVLYEECLARLTGLDGRVHSAGEFIPPLELFGAAPLVDQHILGLVLDQLDHDSEVILGCNLSADNFRSEAHWDGVLEQIRSRPHLASRLILELTESQALQSLSFSANAIMEIRGFGCRVALDDFGAGFASPRLVQIIDFDIVKIDKAFVQDIRRSTDGSDSFHHIVAFASCFAPIVVAEGIETKEQIAVVRSAGATHIQGHFFSLPILRTIAVKRDAEVS
ncbi:EAL domain-containing protein [Agrobacterium tumefaciens]|uniref:EAL domain-containing protein n=1 Tax=Agrobacterium tumefaciens TaxID=358 RepID=UPI002243EF8C|nr:EAL domain-containing protein [Agrobacterium tumefaciens]MCW8060425.1 EAL domain-containing protein [Agrobacterium tumefaciens]MCW8145869.1 EAL domain-containing protein [Agrobacterium tumefaciens]